MGYTRCVLHAKKQVFQRLSLIQSANSMPQC